MKSMGKTYILDITEREFVDGKQARYNASGKPRTDTIMTLLETGASLLELRSLPVLTTKNKLKKAILNIVNIFNLLNQNNIQCKDVAEATIFVQYPFISCPRFVAKRLLSSLHKRGNKLIFIVHDIHSIRILKKRKTDRKILSFADVVIVHSPQMAKALESVVGIDAPTVSLEYFDYRSTINIESQQQLRNVCLIFAGNMSKAPFVGRLPELPLGENFQVNLYGANSKFINENEYIHYKGKFDADEFSSIQGNWGLVWDGDSVSTCHGELGEYLRVNAPFKFSLYLAANRPVVVWRQSALAQYVEQYHLGVCVESLNDIPRVISNLSDKEINTIIDSVSRASAEVRAGKQLLRAVDKALEIISGSRGADDDMQDK